jgi:AcrR family transcriptional regulator
MTENKNQPKRQQILEAAAEVFSSKGYYSAKIEDIAERAGIGKGTVYEYFPSKEELFRVTLKEGTSFLMCLIREQVERETTIRGKLLAFTKKNIEIGRRYRVLSKTTILITGLIDEELCDCLLEMHKELLRTVENVIQGGIEAGQLKPVDVNMLANVFSGGVTGACSPLINKSAERDEESLATEIVDYFLDGIAVSKGLDFFSGNRVL